MRSLPASATDAADALRTARRVCTRPEEGSPDRRRRCRRWVKSGKARAEHLLSGLSPIADERAVGPQARASASSLEKPTERYMIFARG